MLDEVADAIELRWFVARPHADPQADAHTQHVRHLCRGDCQTILELCDVIHSLPTPNGPTASIQHPPPRIQRPFTLPTGLYLACTTHVPRIYLACTSQSPPNYLACTWLVPGLHQKFQSILAHKTSEHLDLTRG